MWTPRQLTLSIAILLLLPVAGADSQGSNRGLIQLQVEGLNVQELRDESFSDGLVGTVLFGDAACGVR
jgi:hypothetical protein